MRLRYLLLGFLLGLYIGWVWVEGTSPSPEPTPRKPVSRKPSVPVAKDSLIEIEGIGPAYERALNAIGIFTFAQLAAQDVEKLAERLSSVRVSAARIRRSQWIEQALEKSKAAKSGKQQSWVGNDDSGKAESRNSE